MNYTGRPSISGCRPVLSLYPTHCFCQYLLLIFITFTNSSLFNRAFSTNSRSPLSHAAGVTLPGGGGAQPLRHACGVPPPLPRGGFGIAENFSSSPEAPLLGELSAKQTERLYEGEPFLCRKVRLLASPVSFWRIICYNGFAALPAHLFGRGGEKNGKYSFFYTVCRSKCSSLLYLQVA